MPRRPKSRILRPDPTCDWLVAGQKQERWAVVSRKPAQGKCALFDGRSRRTQQVHCAKGTLCVQALSSLLRRSIWWRKEMNRRNGKESDWRQKGGWKNRITKSPRRDRELHGRASLNSSPIVTQITLSEIPGRGSLTPDLMISSSSGRASNSSDNIFWSRVISVINHRSRFSFRRP